MSCYLFESCRVSLIRKNHREYFVIFLESSNTVMVCCDVGGRDGVEAESVVYYCVLFITWRSKFDFQQTMFSNNQFSFYKTCLELNTPNKKLFAIIIPKSFQATKQKLTLTTLHYDNFENKWDILVNFLFQLENLLAYQDLYVVCANFFIKPFISLFDI